jgi:hypothetical protein
MYKKYNTISYLKKKQADFADSKWIDCSESAKISKICVTYFLFTCKAGNREALNN